MTDEEDDGRALSATAPSSARWEPGRRGRASPRPAGILHYDMPGRAPARPSPRRTRGSGPRRSPPGGASSATRRARGPHPDKPRGLPGIPRGTHRRSAEAATGTASPAFPGYGGHCPTGRALDRWAKPSRRQPMTPAIPKPPIFPGQWASCGLRGPEKNAREVLGGACPVGGVESAPRLSRIESRGRPPERALAAGGLAGQR